MCWRSIQTECLAQSVLKTKEELAGEKAELKEGVVVDDMVSSAGTAGKLFP